MAPKILVVDDEGLLAEMLRMILETSIPCTVDTALDGRQALDKAREWLPDVMLVDMRMPGMDGQEVCRRIKDDPETSAIRVVYVTGSERPSGGLEGAEGFVGKPIDTAELLRVVSHLLPS